MDAYSARVHAKHRLGSAAGLLATMNERSVRPLFEVVVEARDPRFDGRYDHVAREKLAAIARSVRADLDRVETLLRETRELLEGAS